MGDKSGIEWTDATWNPTVGCTKVSPGCKHCYAATLHPRLREMGSQKYAEPFTSVKPWEPHLDQPQRWKRPRLIFVNSMSDLFHEAISLDYLKRVFRVMQSATQHQFQILTKRSERLRDVAHELEWPPNVWMGVSVESSDYVYRIDDLATVPAAIRFVSAEPLLGPLGDLPLELIDWVIVGGESGRGARQMDLDWVRQVRLQCELSNTAFFLKQLGGVRNKRGGEQATLDGRLWRSKPLEPAARSFGA